MKDLKPASKLWLETGKGYVVGPGLYELLAALKEEKSLQDACKSLGMSYRFAWGLIRKAEEALDSPLVETHRGGLSGGGSTELTPLGEWFLGEYRALQEAWEAFKDQYPHMVEAFGRVVAGPGGKPVIEASIPLPNGTGLREGDRVRIKALILSGLEP